MATKKKPAPRKKAPARKPTKKPAAKKPTKPPAPKKPDGKAIALAWFANLSDRIHHATVEEFQGLIAEARTYDLVGLEQLLGDHDQVLTLNRAANDLIAAAIDTFGAASPVGFQLQVLRDILNDS